MEKNMKKRMIQLGVCVGLLCVIWGGYLAASKKIAYINKMKDIRNQSVEVNHSIIFDIENIRIEDDVFSISGWAFQHEEDGELNVILQPVGGMGGEVLNAIRTEREDVQIIFETAPIKSGFCVELDADEIKKDMGYEILLSFSHEKKDTGKETISKITTGHYVYNGELFRVYPGDFSTPDVGDEYIRDVVEHGEIYAYDNEKKVWIYLYENKIHCISDVDYVVSLDKVPSIPIEFYTCFEESIPEERRENYTKKGFDFYEIYLKEEHCIRGEDATYYVVSLDVPEYPITYVRIGTYGNRGDGWISCNEFQIDLKVE